ncbi:MAG: hypothetical protein M3071_19065 [Actinomycetota bacterium]|nr:hypothetical protein [Actinomycetota bacterium]
MRGARPAGNVLTSTDPTGGTRAWSLARRDRRLALEAVSCPSTSLCLAADEAGRVLLGTSR